jgi:ectoine hydroxylase-related dioxygenase (phytanoyl-CoA dioxygenase family)
LSATDVDPAASRAANIAAMCHPVTSTGFDIIESVFSDSQIQQIAAHLEHSSLPHSKAGMRHLMRDPRVSELAYDPCVLTLAQHVLGPAAFPFRATLFDKAPDKNWLVVWHQDTALPLQQKINVPGWGPWSVKDGITYAHAPAPALEKILAIRIHLDDSAADNGPLRILPSTHNRGVLTDDTIHELSLQIAPIDCSVGRGGIVLMRPLLVHASSKSRSEKSRRVLHIEYASATNFDGLELAKA